MSQPVAGPNYGYPAQPSPYGAPSPYGPYGQAQAGQPNTYGAYASPHPPQNGFYPYPVPNNQAQQYPGAQYYGEPRPSAYATQQQSSQQPKIWDLEGGQEDISLEQFNIDTRQAFVRKVFALFGLQMALVVVLNGILYATRDSYKAWLTGNQWFVWTTLAAFLVLGISMNYKPIFNVHPRNLICLFTFSAITGIMVSFSVVQYNLASVAMAFGITFVVCLSLIVFAWTTKIDFTTKGLYLLVGFVVLLCVMIIALVFRNIPYIQTIYAGLGSLLFSMFIVYDVQLIVGGKHRKVSFGPDAYVIAAMSLFLDVINLFLMILSFFRGGSD